ncbi:hypothetical protein [Sphingobacterium detergens]|uniref:Uncharacterized protein n=1 Tax=Sphingobacterium detergens TaxID=1145106 RepID=A0A420BF63_SPHD1|nr:hypothetical protein [Sphingobacterium detergens]RKE55351.1 hypothetical protein DFQ12_0182 [Sphingobacterium detergens]
MKSPFEYTSPEALTAKDIIDLFVPYSGEYYNVPNLGHTFLNGPRGSGKSMYFRYMEPDCQSIVQGKEIKNLDYLALHLPIKEGQLDKTDLSLLKNKHGEHLINEHFMVINFSIKIFENLSRISFEESEENLKCCRFFIENVFFSLLKDSYWDEDYSIEGISTIQQCFIFLRNICKDINRDFTRTLISQIFLAEGKHISYSGPLCLFNGFMLNFLEGLKELPFFPRGPIYLMIDDADNLNIIQTKILNTWVSLRISKIVSLKISTQLRYKTYKTINNSRIDTPHDYSEINISDIYTTKKSLYRERIKEAVERRLRKFTSKSNISVDEYFPSDKDQEKKINQLFEEYKKKNGGEKKGYDFAYRYARADFIKNLQGNRNHYSYAGFDNLVNISSGVMRHFIDFSHRMFTMQLSKQNEKEEIRFITPIVQDEQIKEYSKWFLEENFAKLKEDASNSSEELNDFVLLRNLLEALGQTFHLILISDSKERRVFSFALQDDPNEELRKVLKLGVELGYFQKSLIGNKMGTGQAQLYILNRLLAPYFKLDPTSFAGYKFVTCQILLEAMTKPNTFVGRLKRSGVNSAFEDNQLTLFT